MTETPIDMADRLAERMAQPLPGWGAQSDFAPELSFGRHGGPPPHDARCAAVVALLFRTAGEWAIPLTLRPDYLPDHAGQVCFPGGTLDPGESAEEAALRELHEELGVGRHQVQIVGSLSPLYVFASNFWVTPFVAVSGERLQFVPNPQEVAELVFLRTATLLDRDNHGSHWIERKGVGFNAPHIRCGEHRIWGATSMMLAELIAVLRDVDILRETG